MAEIPLEARSVSSPVSLARSSCFAETGKIFSSGAIPAFSERTFLMNAMTVSLRHGQVVDLVLDEEDAGYLLPDVPEEIDLHLGDGRVSRDQKERRVALREEIECHLGIVPVRGTYPGRIDEDDVPEDAGRVGDLHGAHSLPVLRIRLLGDIIEQDPVHLLRRLAGDGPIFSLFQEMDLDGPLRSVPDESRDGGQRDDRTREDVFPEKGIEQRALPPLELPQHSKLEPPLGEAVTEAGKCSFLRFHRRTEVMEDGNSPPEEGGQVRCGSRGKGRVTISGRNGCYILCGVLHDTPSCTGGFVIQIEGFG